MLSNRGIERVAGTLFLLLVATVIVSIATEVEVDTDTAEFRESLQDVAGDRGRHLVGVSFALLSGLLAVGLAWSFYLVFRTHERPLALLAAFGFLAAGLVFVVEETTRFALDSLAQEFAAARGSEAHAAHAVETSARAVALVGEFAHEIAITFLGLGVLVAGILISWSEPVPRIYGWVAGLGGFLLLFPLAPVRGRRPSSR